MDSEKIMIIEDDEDIREGVRILLQGEVFDVVEADCGETGLSLFSDDIDLVILDIMMPGMNGIKVCEELRKISYVPILFLTAKVQESDKLLGLVAGGDDYLTKPFSYSELFGRVKALVRRYRCYQGKEENGTDTQLEYIEEGDIRINVRNNEVKLLGEPIDLTDTEYKLLYLFMSNKGKVFSAQNLYESTWNEPYFYNCNGTVMVHIRNLRVKIEKDPQNPMYIKTVWGKGYKFEV